MRALIVLFLGVSNIFISLACYGQSKNSDPTPRTFITPQGASKVRIYEAKQRKFADGESKTDVETMAQVSSTGFAKSCNTTIGPTTNSQNNAGANSGRYGAGSGNKDSTVIVTGDVINVCK